MAATRKNSPYCYLKRRESIIIDRNPTIDDSLIMFFLYQHHLDEKVPYHWATTHQQENQIPHIGVESKKTM
jgi:hypothetical protein